MIFWVKFNSWWRSSIKIWEPICPTDHIKILKLYYWSFPNHHHRHKLKYGRNYVIYDSTYIKVFMFKISIDKSSNISLVYFGGAMVETHLLLVAAHCYGNFTISIGWNQFNTNWIYLQTFTLFDSRQRHDPPVSRQTRVSHVQINKLLRYWCLKTWNSILSERTEAAATK